MLQIFRCYILKVVLVGARKAAIKRRKMFRTSRSTFSYILSAVIHKRERLCMAAENGETDSLAVLLRQES